MFMLRQFLAVILLISICACDNGNDNGNGNGNGNVDDTEYIMLNDDLVMVNLSETPEAFPNPMKGFRPGTGPDGYDFWDHEYALVYRQYVKYSDLESSATDTTQKIINWSNSTWKNIAGKNIKIIPRVVLTYPRSNQPGAVADDYWPEDISQTTVIERWFTEELEGRLSNFIKKLGEAWDNDPRIAAIELGLWGHWGEHHLYPLSTERIPLNMQKVLGDAVSLAFKNKKVLVRYPNTFLEYELGFYWDSFALPDDSWGGDGIIERDVWKTQMISGEVAYDWGDQSLLGGSPDATIKNNNAVEYLIEWINRIHASSLGWIDRYSQNDSSLSQNAARVQKALGYRYTIKSAIYNRMTNPGDELSIELNISNVGSAPFYYQWPLELSLLNAQRRIVWKQKINTDIREWLPNENITVTEKVIIPSTISNGSYILAVSIVDPSGDMPSLRFANANYYNGGRTPLGIIGIGQEPKYYSLRPYNSLKADKSIHYSQ